MRRESEDIFVIVLKTKQAGFSLAGEKVTDVLIRGLKDLPYVITQNVESCNTKQHDYVAVVYDDMALLTKEYLLQCCLAMQKQGIKAVNIGDGLLADYAAFYLEGLHSTMTYMAINTLRVNDLHSLQQATEQVFLRIAFEHIANGVQIIAPNLCYIDYAVRLEKGAVIYPFCSILGNSVIQKGAVINSYSVIQDSVIQEGATVTASNISCSIVGQNSTVGPFAVLRQGTVVENNVRIGDFVEIKNSTVKSGAKAAHLSYIGDATVGQNTNVGCGTVFANYDGKTKHTTTVGANTFIGCNTNLIAPITIGDNCFIAGGSTITQSMQDDTFAIERDVQRTKQRKR